VHRATSASTEKKDAVLEVQSDPREEVHAQGATSRTNQSRGAALVAWQRGAGTTSSLAAALKAEGQVATRKSAHQSNTNVSTYTPPPNAKSTHVDKLRCLTFGTDQMALFSIAFFCGNYIIVEAYPPHKRGEKLVQNK
jgi:hypothetical protein